MNQYSYVTNSHSSYIEELYQQYKQDPASVDESWQNFFKGFEFSFETKAGENGHASNGAEGTVDRSMLRKEVAVMQLIEAYRSYGHLVSKTNPIRPRRDRKARLAIQDFGLSESDLDTFFEAGMEIGIGRAKLRDIVSALKLTYEGAIGFEFMSIREPEIFEWFKTKVEKEALTHKFSIEQKKRILSKLNEAVVFENFLHTKFVGQKRFSLEGGESTIPALDAIINKGAELGVEHVVIGMAHRGRLNVLTNIMGKTYEQVFTEFEGSAIPDETMGDGDVKYHLGFASQIPTPSGKMVSLNLIPNPSHLEAVNPVVVGYSRAEADTVLKNDYKKILPILIHGDAAVAGQGIVYETTQMSQLAGYEVGGTIHFIINNQVGFTTDFTDARSSIYCTDVSQIIEAPEIHVNGDDPEAVVYAVQLAVEFRQRYHRDIYVDMVCYRKHGHNESDEPRFTQPMLYDIIAKHKNPREIYNEKLLSHSEISAELAQDMDREFRQLLNDRLGSVRQNPLPYKTQPLEKQWQQLRRSTPDDFLASPFTGISEETFQKVAKALVTLPADFKPLRQIEKLISERNEMFFDKKQVNWAAAELMAYGSILADGKIVRLTGQDVQRGTFSHRHAVLTNVENNSKYNSLSHIGEGQGRFEIYNSLLSEYAVLGFEFGYAMANPNALVIWEAQFGDFANGAQIIIDQFISSTESKWHRMSGLVMLLPHGYEGQGPEHSNARPERFLQLSAEYNIVVANVTTPANIFHMMRRQLTWEFRKPCILMSPKSMLRHPRCVSSIDELKEGRFREVIGDTYCDNHGSVEKALLCSGKIYYDLNDYQTKENRKDVAVIRVEQLHPFPEAQVEAELAKYPNLKKVVWVQEEPVNMGYWQFIMRTYMNVRPGLELVARKPSASPATGFKKLHDTEQDRIVKAAFNR